MMNLRRVDAKYDTQTINTSMPHFCSQAANGAFGNFAGSLMYGTEYRNESESGEVARRRATDASLGRRSVSRSLVIEAFSSTRAH